MTLFIHLNELEIEDRQRTEIATSALNELAESIMSPKGLLHPPVAWLDETTGKWKLVCGERRIRALTKLKEAGRVYCYAGAPVEPGLVPITPLSDLSYADLVEAELEENIMRVDLSWQDRVKALAAVHRARVAANPTQTKSDTARELAAKAGIQSLAKDGQAPSTVRRHLSQALILADRIDDPKIAKARNAAEAESLVLKAEEEKLFTLLSKRRRESLGDVQDEIELRHGSLFDVLPGLGENLVDLLLVDPPYGIGAGSAGFRGRTVHHHNYEDTEENAREVASSLLEEGFRICKSRANLFMFCDIKRWAEFRTMAARLGWEVFPRPVIWQKSESEGLAPWGRQGFRITYDAILYATKGGRGLITSPVDIINVKRVPRSERIYAAEKPVDLLRLLIECSTLPGDFVLDPCMGSGSTLVAARETQRRGMGIEVDEDAYNTAVANVYKGEELEDEE